MMIIDKEKKIFEYFTKRKSSKFVSNQKLKLMKKQLVEAVDRVEVHPQQKVIVEQSLYKGHSEIKKHKQLFKQSAKSETEEGSLRSREAKVQKVQVAKVQPEDAERSLKDKVQPKFLVNLT